MAKKLYRHFANGNNNRAQSTHEFLHIWSMFVFVFFSSSTFLAAEKALMDKIAVEEKQKRDIGFLF